MGPRCWPEHPAFANDAEKTVWQAVRKSLRDGDVLLHGMRFTDPEDGDVEIDLLVLMPDKGAAVIEVKGGRISYAQGTVWQMRAGGPEEIDPAEQAAKEVRALRRYFDRWPDPVLRYVRSTWLVAFPQTRPDGDLGPRLRRDVIIGADDFEDAAGMIFDRLEDPVLQRWHPRTGWVDAALDALLGVYNQGAEISSRTAERLQHVDQLTEQQSALLSVVRRVPRFEVVGPAGSGKTWMAMEQARRWSEAGERVALVTYTRGVVEAMRRALSDAPPAQHPAWIGTFFQLGAVWGIKADGSADRDFWNRRGPESMLEHAASLPEGERFTALVVDEAQDFADSWWAALLAAATPDAKVAVLRDDEQAVFTERRGRPDIALVPLTLDENLRNAQEIVDTFRPLVVADVITRAGSGFPLEYVTCSPDDVIEIADRIVGELVDRRGWLPEHVALLTTKHRHPVQREYEADKDAYWNDLWDTDDVFYSTVAGFKGLERPAVVLAVDGFHDDLDPAKVLYTGMSRARDLLIVVAPTEVMSAMGGKKFKGRLRYYEREAPK